MPSRVMYPTTSSNFIGYDSRCCFKLEDLKCDHYFQPFDSSTFEKKAKTHKLIYEKPTTPPETPTSPHPKVLKEPKFNYEDVPVDLEEDSYVLLSSLLTNTIKNTKAMRQLIFEVI